MNDQTKIYLLTLFVLMLTLLLAWLLAVGNCVDATIYYY